MTGDLCALSDVKSRLGLGKVMETAVVPGLPGSYTCAVKQASIWEADLFVVYSGGVPLAAVSGTPQPGQYRVTAGSYLFASADSGKSVIITYSVTQQDDELLGDLITAASEDVRQETGRTFDVESYDEFYSGAGGRQRQLWTRQWPIVSVTALLIHGQPIPESPDRIQPGYAFSVGSGKIVLIGRTFPRGVDNIELRYQAGYPTIPTDLAQAAVKLVMYRYKSDSWIGQKSKSLGGEVVAFVTDHMPADVLRVCQRYKKVIPC